jgi:hypothetical protein
MQRDTLAKGRSIAELDLLRLLSEKTQACAEVDRIAEHHRRTVEEKLAWSDPAGRRITAPQRLLPRERTQRGLPHHRGYFALASFLQSPDLQAGARGQILVMSDSPREDGIAKKHRPTLSRTIYLPTGATLVTVIVFPSVETSPVNWTLAPAFAASAAKF